MAEKFRFAVQELGVPHESSATAPHVTISLGVASAVPSLTEKPESIIRHADRLLYQAKHNGRNRVECPKQ
jgi:diguanylate cyclase (GGDEF)-like protein